MDLNWETKAGATEEELNRLINKVNVSLPDEYIAFLRQSNGGEGDLALEPMWLQLWSIDQVLEYQQIEPFTEYPDYFFFASNGGMESIAFKIDDSIASEIVMLDLMEGIESCKKIANDFLVFEEAIGKEYNEG